MDINQNNYEAFFLLYVDDELSAAEKLCVEMFIQQYPYLVAELQVLKDMVLPAEEIVLQDKDMLYRLSSIEGNMQEAMLLKLDNELPASENEALQIKIAEDQTMGAAWEILNRTKLDANDKIVFPHKQSLYRREKTGAVVYGRFTSWAVAAALIATGFFAGVTIVNNQDSEQNNTANLPQERPAIRKGVTTPKPADKPTSVSDNKNLTAGVHAPADAARQQQDKTIVEVAITNPAETKVRRAKTETVQTVNAGASEIKDKLPENMHNNQQNILAASHQKLKVVRPLPQEVSTVLTATPERVKQEVGIVDRNLTPAESSYAHSTLMEEPQQNDNHILFMDEEDVARTKAGIFFKKLKRTVTRSTNIKSGNSLKIAGFEFAVK